MSKSSRKMASPQGLKDVRSHLAHVVRDPVLAQSTIDTLSDILDVPLTLVRIPTLESLQTIILSQRKGQLPTFSNPERLKQFITDAAERPLSIIERLNDYSAGWQSLLRALASDTFVTRGAGIDP